MLKLLKLLIIDIDISKKSIWNNILTLIILLVLLFLKKLVCYILNFIFCGATPRGSPPFLNGGYGPGTSYVTHSKTAISYFWNKFPLLLILRGTVPALYCVQIFHLQFLTGPSGGRIGKFSRNEALWLYRQMVTLRRTETAFENL